MKLLFVCTTEFQLITALNIKYHMHPDDDADIIVDNYHGEEKELAERIRETKLFRKVYYVRSYIEHETLHKYFRSISDGEPGIGLAYAIKNSLLFLKMRIMTKIFGSGAYISNMLAFSETFSIEEYDAFFAYGDKPITCKLTHYILEKNRQCKKILLDEGIGTYTIPNMGKYSDIIDSCYVYDPDLVVHDKRTYKIPCIQKEDKKFIALLNGIFLFNHEDVEDYRDSIIVFNQDGRAKMPKYLQNPSWWIKILFHNSFKRHLKEEEEYNAQDKVMHLAIAFASDAKKTRKVLMKLNPRAAKSTIEDYMSKSEIQLVRRYDIPWELVALNCPLGNTVFLTNYSSAVCLFDPVVDNTASRTRCILLYKLGTDYLDKVYDCFFEKLVRKYNNIYIPFGTSDLKQCIGD